MFLEEEKALVSVELLKPFPGRWGHKGPDHLGPRKPRPGFLRKCPEDHLP